MDLKPASIHRGDTLYVPVSKLERGFGNYSINVKATDDKTVTISPPIQSTILLVGTTNPDLPAYGATSAVRSTKYYTAFYYDTVEDAQSALEQLQTRNDVQYAEFNTWITPVPVEPTEAPSTLRASYNGDDESVKGATNYDAYVASTTGTLSNVTVAVLDTGFGSTDPIFDGRIVGGYDVANNDNTISNPNVPHGTNVASMIALFSRPNVKIMPIKVFKDGAGMAASSDTINGIYYGINQGVNVFNISLSGGSNGMEAALNAAYNSNIITVMAAGNEGVDASTDTAASSPLVLVGAVDSYTAGYPKWSLTNFGDMVDTYAPGATLCAANEGDSTSWSWYSGTSLSSPIVAGGLADILGYQMTRNKQLTAATAKAFVRLSNTSDGRLNLVALNNMNISAILGSYSGAGTSSNPYMINSTAQLQTLANMTRLGFQHSGLYFKLGSNLTLAGNWIPVGCQTSVSSSNSGIVFPFSGNFDGNGNTITITSSPASPYSSSLGCGGVFGYMDGGSVSNLDVVISGNIIAQTRVCFGGIAGQILDGTSINGCSVTGGTITAGNSNVNVGGLVGLNGFINNLNGDSSSISNCYTNLNIVGAVNKIMNVYVPIAYDTTQAGGLVAYNNASISNCYSASNVSIAYGSGYDFAGTLIGCTFMGASVTNCYWKDFGSSPSGIGGFGFLSNPVTPSGGGARTDAQLKDPSTFVGWDFSNIWKMNPAVNNGYPNLRSAGVISYTVAFDAQGGTVSPASQTVTNGSAVGTLPVATRTGYTFGGWWTATNGSGTQYTPATVATGDITLYAKWTPITYTVVYNGNGSTSGSTASSSHTYDVAKALTSNGFTRAYTVTYNYNGNGQSNETETATCTFKNWDTSSGGGGTTYTDGQSVMNLTSTAGETINLYAQWNSSSVTLPTPTRAGYTFAGWYTAASGGANVGSGGATYTPAVSVTLYAQWTPVPYTISTSSNPAAGGATNGGGTYNSGASCTVNATASNGYSFVNWTENGAVVSTNPSYTFTVSADRNLVANFEQQTSWQIGDPTPANVIASFNNGILTITGTGTMQNFDPATRPWVGVKDNITSIVINNGVTTIGNGAFEDLSNLTSVTIPNSMIKIGEHAFLVCPKLISLPNGIGNSVQEIQYGAFDKCSSLTSINIPGSVNTIAQWAFAFMDALNSVTVNWATPFMLTDGSVFSSIDLSKVTLNVPSGTACAYAAADYWKDFNIVGASFTVTPSAGSGGSISPNTVQTLACGSNITFTATPNSGKQVDQWLLNGSVVQTGGTTYTTSNIQANATLQVTFKDTPPVYFTITATAGSGGVISPSGSVPVSSGANQTFTFTPNTNYDIDQVMVDGVVNSTAKANGYYAFSNVTAPHTISVTFKQIQQYTVSTSSNPVAGGTTSGDGAYFSGTSCTVSALANTGYVFESWTENGAVVSTNPSYTFTVSNDRSLVANFTKIKSNDATLGSLTVSSGTLNPVFNADTTNYTVEVTNDVSSITIDAIANSSAATISGTGTKSINVGSNTVTVTVTAEDGTTKIYTIVINRPNITAINEVKNTNLNIYPNPTKNELFIKTDLQIKKVEISDLTGHNVKILNATSVQNGIQTISVSSLLKGIYLVKVYTDNSVVISKIVKE